MDILPENFGQFRDKTYWDHFFTSLKHSNNQFFQWYGNYQDYKQLLTQLLPPISPQPQQIFHVGCGKSTFTEQLLQHAASPKPHIINCDYSQTVIKQMKDRAIKYQIDMEYVVCDLLGEIDEAFVGNFDLVIDKGTLDAMLSEDLEVNVAKIKDRYFGNMGKVIKVGGKFVIISLLQPFVLSTVLEYYAFRNNYNVQIYECLIKDSKLQPFLICISPVAIKQQQQIPVLLHRLGAAQPTMYKSIPQAMQGVQKIQKQMGYGQKIEQLVSGRHLIFNIYNKENKKKIRYQIQAIDSQHKQTLLKNSCSIFIIPQGKQSTYIFSDPEGKKSLHTQIGSSRLLLIQLVTGNTFTNLQEVKKQLNPIISDFVQKGCDVKSVSYLTDADQLGQRRYLYMEEGDQFIFDEVVVEGDCIRRMFLRGNLFKDQCSFKLTYMSETNNKGLREIGSKIMPPKKGMVTGIDKQELFDDYARFIYSGLTALHSHPKQGWKVLILGCQFALAKFLIENYQNIEVTIVCGNHKSAKAIVPKYLQISESSSLAIHSTSVSQYIGDHPEQKFSMVIDCSRSNEGEYPPRQQTSVIFLQKIYHILEMPGIYVSQYGNYQKMPSFQTVFYPVYGSKTNSLNGETENIVFCLMFDKKYKEGAVILHESQAKLKPKSKPDYKWQIQNIEDIILLYPKVSVELDKVTPLDATQVFLTNDGTFEDIYGHCDKSEKKKKKKKKK